MCSPTDMVILYIAVRSAVLNNPPLPGATSIYPQLPMVLSACSSRRLPRLSLPLFRSPSCPVCSLCLCVLRSRRYCLLLLVFLPALFAFPSPASCVTWISAHQRSFFRLLAPCPSACPLSPPRSLLSFSFLFFSYASLRGLVTLYSISAIWSGLPCDGAHPCSYAPAGCLRGLLHGRSLFLCQVRIWHCFRHHATRVLRSPH